MEHIAAFMLLIACNDDLSICEEKPTSQVAYETVQACSNDIDQQIRKQDIYAPTVVAKCVEVDPMHLYRDASITWSFDGRELEVAIESEAPSQEYAELETQNGA